MEGSLKGLFTLFLAAYFMASFDRAYGAEVCPGSSPDQEATKLWPCAGAAQDENARVSPACCKVVTDMATNKECMCAVMLSDTAKNAHVNPKIAITIPKRCKIATRPVGYKCGNYTLP